MAPHGFKKDTKILCFKNGVEIYVQIQDIKKGDSVKTFHDGYLKVDMIGKSVIYNNGNDKRTTQKLYKYTKATHSEITEDLIITGSHSILVKKLSDDQINKSIDLFSRVNRTGKHYRLASIIDADATPYDIEGTFGLLVESCSKYYMKDLELTNEQTTEKINEIPYCHH